jgi:thioredoxin-related protein
MTPKILNLILWLALVCGTTAFVSQTAAAQSPYTPVTKYDPKRDAARDIDDAVAEAKRSNRRILLVVGGEWCSWCHILDNYFAAHPDLKRLRDKNFVTVKINFSDEHPNETVLSRYPPAEGYPHIFVLDSDGKFLHSQGTAVFEEGRGYVLERLTTFLTHWAPPVKARTAP